MNAGEISPELQGRIDLDKFAAGVNFSINFILRDYGGAERRPGFGYVAAVKTLTLRLTTLSGDALTTLTPAYLYTTVSDSPQRLIPFVYNDVQSYIVELGDFYARFYMLGGQIATSGTPYEIVTPFEAEDLFRIQYASRGDVTWLTHPDYQLQVLTRTAHSNWTIADFESDTGPFLDPNATTTTMTPSVTTPGATGTLTASASYFDSDMVGTLFRIEEDDTNAYSMWEPAKAYLANAVVRYGSNVYICTNAGTSGAVAPVHTTGKRFDGQLATACEWDYQHSGYGVCRVTGYTSATIADIEVLSLLPSTAAVTNWREGAFSDHRGWPVACCFQGSRLWFAGTRTQPQTCWGSVAGDPYDFTPGTNADDAVTFTILAQDANPIRTLGEANKALYLLTASRVFAVAGSNGGPIKPDDIVVNAVTRRGSNGVQPINVDRALLFADQSGKRLQELGFQVDADDDAARNLNKLASHILRPGR
jgi:hypothetical protein